MKSPSHVRIMTVVACLGLALPAPAQQVEADPTVTSEETESVNVRVDLRITDAGAAGEAIEKHLSLTVLDGVKGSVRSENFVAGRGEYPLHVDITPRILDERRLRVDLMLQYDLPVNEGSASEQPGMTMQRRLQESLGFVLTDGQPLAVSQSADPTSERRVTIEVTGTVLR